MISTPSTPNLQDTPQKQPVPTATLPIFVPYRGHTSSPQLVLKKLPPTNDPDTPDFRYTQCTGYPSYFHSYSNNACLAASTTTL